MGLLVATLSGRRKIIYMNGRYVVEDGRNRTEFDTLEAAINAVVKGK
jgi:hypothetical protein